MTDARTPGAPTLAVAALRPADTDQTAQLHQTLLPHGLFPRLGRRYMRRWHQTFVDSPFAVALAATDERGAVHAFLLATTDEARYKHEVLTSWRFALAWRGALALAVRPVTAVHFVRTRLARYARRLWAGPGELGNDAQNQPAPAPQRIGVIHAIACVPSCRGRGVGAALLGQYQLQAQDAGTTLVQLITRQDDGAAEFYRRLGWSQTQRRTDHDGKAVIQMDYRPEVL